MKSNLILFAKKIYSSILFMLEAGFPNIFLPSSDVAFEMQPLL